MEEKKQQEVQNFKQQGKKQGMWGKRNHNRKRRMTACFFHSSQVAALASLIHYINSSGRWSGMSQHQDVCPGCNSVCQYNYKQYNMHSCCKHYRRYWWVVMHRAVCHKCLAGVFQHIYDKFGSNDNAVQCTIHISVYRQQL